MTTYVSSIRQARSAHALSISQVADLTGLDPETVAAVEGGRGKVASFVAVITSLGLTVRNCPDGSSLGKWIKKLRTVRGWSLATLAENAGLSKPTLINLERDRGHIQSVSAALQALDTRIELVSCLGGSAEVHHADAREFLPLLAPASVHACVTDPPYHMAEHTPGFSSAIIAAWAAGRDFEPSKPESWLGEPWDAALPQPSLWRQVHRALVPGGFVLAFATPKNADLVGVSLRLAGFELRDQIAWVHRNGMPRGPDVGRMLARAKARTTMSVAPTAVVNGVSRRRYPAVGARQAARTGVAVDYLELIDLPDEEKRWVGARSTLKPSMQIIIVARKPIEGRLIDNVTRHGTGAFIAEPISSEKRSRFSANVLGDINPDEPFFYSPRATPGEKDRFLPEGMKNTHPTVKPINLMRHLIRLATIPGATVLDPFAGSGTTGVACVLESRTFIGIEAVDQYTRIARCRIEGWRRHIDEQSTK